jgi:C-terminal processing protease CtpA/Prc
LDFIDWYSEKSPGSVIGWLGGNVLRGFRITIDYPKHMTYWLRQTELDPHDLDQIGLTLQSKSGEYLVAAIATQNGKSTVEGVQAGDKLLQIGGLQTGTATWGAIFSAMHGKPGEVRILLFERDSKQFTVQAKVVGF